MENTIVKLPKSDFLISLEKIINGRFVSKASPKRVDFFTHDMAVSTEANQEAALRLSTEPCEILRKLPEGPLNLYKDAIVLITNDLNFPVKFYCAWSSVLFGGNSAIQTQQIWADPKIRHLRIDGLPLGAFCLFKVLIPRYKIVIGADEHTPDGERHAKNQVKYAINKGISVYAIDEFNKLYNITTQEFIEKNENLLWGVDPKHKKRLLIYSEDSLF